MRLIAIMIFVVLFKVAYSQKILEVLELPQADEISVLIECVNHFYQQGEMEKVYLLGKVIAALDSNEQAGYMCQGLYWENRANYDSALYYYGYVNENFPSEVISLKLAEIYMKLDKDNLVIASLNEAVTREKEFYFFLAGQHRNEKSLVADTLLRYVGFDYKALRKRRDWFWSQKQYAHAVDDMSELIRYQPFGDNYLYRGKMYYEWGRYDSALRDFDRALNSFRFKPLTDTLSLYIFRAASLGKSGRFRESLNLYKQAEKKYGTVAELYYYRGITYNDRGKRVRACREWHKAEKLGYQVSELVKQCR